MRNPRFDKLKILYPRKVGDIGKLKRLGEQVSRGFFLGRVFIISCITMKVFPNL